MLGRYQFQSPSNIMDAGRSTALTIVASIRKRSIGKLRTLLRTKRWHAT
jgi:hypothetical protein